MSNWRELRKLRHDPRIKLISLHPLHSNRMEVVYEHRAETLGLQKNAQCIVYAHVTAYSRLLMMQYAKTFMSQGVRLFYTDTGKI